MVSKELKIGGSVVFWSLDWTDIGTLADAFNSQGIAGYIPAPRTETSVLKSALVKHFGRKDYIIRPLEDRTGFDVSTEMRGEEENEYTHNYSFRVESELQGSVGKVSIVNGNAYGAADMLTTIQGKYDGLKNLASPAVMGGMMVKLVDQCDGVALRPTGGVYWIPDEHLGKWEQIAEAVEKSGKTSTCYSMHTAFDGEMVKAVRDGITMEVNNEVDDIESAVTSGRIGKRACEARVTQSAELEAKLARYEKALGESMTVLHGALGRASTAAAQAAMQAVLSAGNETNETKGATDAG